MRTLISNLGARARQQTLALACFGALSGLAGCVVDNQAEQQPFACTASSQCIAGFYCDSNSGTCASGVAPDGTPADFGGRDASRTDSVVDGEVGDAASSDAAPSDSAPNDAGYPDATRLDSQIYDAEADDAEADAAEATDLALPSDLGPPDMATPPDSEVPPPFCESADEFADCGADPATQSRCIRQRCCDPAVEDHRCNPIGPGFANPFDTVPNQRFRVVQVPVLEVGSENASLQTMIVDLGTGLSWLPLSLNFLSAASAAQGCRERRIADLGEGSAINNLPNPPPGLIDGSRPRLPDAYELWSLLSFVTPTDRAADSPAQVFRDFGYDPEVVDPNGRIVTSVVTAQGSHLAADYASRHMTMAAANARMRAICVVGGHRPGSGTEPRRIQGGGGGDWTDPWSRRTWRFMETYDLDAGPPVPANDLLGAACNSNWRGAVLPSVFDVVTRFDLRGENGADLLNTFDLYLAAQAAEIPIIVAEPIGNRRLAVEPRRMWGSDLAGFPGFVQRKHYCLAPGGN